MSYLIPGAALCGFIASEAMSIIPAIKQNESTPNTFSFRYYFSRPENVVMFVFNCASTLGMMLAHGEIIGLMHKMPLIGTYFEGAALPTLTGLLTGFFAARVIRWVVSKWPA